MKNIAIIPARSGSKGLKNKNIKLLNGKPLLAYSIEAAMESGMFDVIHVSTDSKEYSEIAKTYGAHQPFLRELNNSVDTSSTWDVVVEVLNKYSKLGYEFDNFMLLQPTSPLRTSMDIVNSFNEMKLIGASSIVSVSEAEHSPFLINTLPYDKSMNNFIKIDLNKSRRQDLGVYYRINGAIYLANVNKFLENGNIYKQQCYAYVMKQENAIDIDNQLDFDIAEFLIKKRNG